MNSEHMSKKQIGDYYGLQIINEGKEKGKYVFSIFGGIVVKYTSNINKSLEKLYQIEQTMKDYNEMIIKKYIVNNNIMIKILTNDGHEYDTDIGGYIKRHEFRKKFLSIISQNGDKLLSSYIDAHTSVLIDHSCGHEPHKVTPNNYMNGAINCPICNHTKIIPHVNDCYTLRPDLIKYFKNKQDAVGIAVYDNVYREFTCPICGQSKITKLSNIVSFGFSCDYCSDGVSYPEKMMGNVLSQLNIKYDTHKRFEWSFYIDKDGKKHNCEYDFVIGQSLLIIEMDGGFHYHEFLKCKTSLQERQEIDRIKDELATQNGYRVVRINCNYGIVYNRFEYIKQSIISSLINIYNLNSVDWAKVDRLSEMSRVEEACTLWESNNQMTTMEIAKKLKLTQASVIQYLKVGQRIGLCTTYSKYMSNKRQAKNTSAKYYKYTKAVDAKTFDVIGVFYDIDNFIYNYYKKFGILMRKQSIREIADGRSKKLKYHNLSFNLITKAEYDSLVDTCQVNDKIEDSNRIIVMSSTHLYDDDLMY